ncbi:MAG: hypothetical protein APF81_17525 [Desulfosporosinus sp. BRH_c37]|nr:MAG: hypothetical protein APF81_17525 [Desulfosporosinus sp. BRH_c37]
MPRMHTKQCEKWHMISDKVCSLSAGAITMSGGPSPKPTGPNLSFRHVGHAQAFMQLRPSGAFSTQ